MGWVVVIRTLWRTVIALVRALRVETLVKGKFDVIVIAGVRSVDREKGHGRGGCQAKSGEAERDGTKLRYG